MALRPERLDQLTIIPEQAEALNFVFGHGPLSLRGCIMCSDGGSCHFRSN